MFGLDLSLISQKTRVFFGAGDEMNSLSITTSSLPTSTASSDSENIEAGWRLLQNNLGTV